MRVLVTVIWVLFCYANVVLKRGAMHNFFFVVILVCTLVVTSRGETKNFISFVVYFVFQLRQTNWTLFVIVKPLVFVFGILMVGNARNDWMNVQRASLISNVVFYECFVRALMDLRKTSKVLSFRSFKSLLSFQEPYEVLKLLTANFFSLTQSCIFYENWNFCTTFMYLLI